MRWSSYLISLLALCFKTNNLDAEFRPKLALSNTAQRVQNWVKHQSQAVQTKLSNLNTKTIQDKSSMGLYSTELMKTLLKSIPLHLAIAFDDVSSISALTERSFLINAIYDNPMSLYTVKKPISIDQIVEQGGFLLYETLDKALIAFDTDKPGLPTPFVPILTGMTPLHIAIHANKLDTVKLLIENGARVDIKFKSDLPLHLAVNSIFDYSLLCKEILKDAIQKKAM